MQMLNSLAGAIVAVAFWAFVAVCAVSGMKYDFRKRQLAMESLRASIERGQPLEPAVVATLLARHSESEADDPRKLAPYLQIGGIITAACGIGMLIAAFPVGLQFPVAKLPILAVGALVTCIGAGLLLASWAAGRLRPRQGSAEAEA
jgi:hypothetical protein